MSFLLDTNVLSELRKGSQCDSNVALWARSTVQQGHFVSVLSLGEITKGIELLRRRNEEQASRLNEWLQRLQIDYADVILPITAEIATLWGELNAVRTLPVIDGLLAATALQHKLTVATRNTADFPQQVEVVNPFSLGHSS